MIWSSVLVALLAGVSLVRCSSEDSFQRDEPANSAKFNQLQTNKLVERSSEENNEVRMRKNHVSSDLILSLICSK